MTDLRELARPHIDAAARFTPDLADLQRRATALRRRRRILTSTGLLGALGVCATVVLVASDQPTRLDTAGRGATAEVALTLQRVEARGGENGTSEVTVVFNAPLPVAEIPTIDSVESVDPRSLVAAVQDPGPGAVEVCGTKHWFPEVPEGSGSVDLLIPASWLAGDPPVLPAVTPLEPAPDKIVLCGPYREHVQISIWGAAPTSTETLDITISEDRTRIIVRISPAQGAECAVSGHATAIVPNVVGRTLAEAIEQVTNAGLAVVARGVPKGDPSLDASIVRAQEPPAGATAPDGACVGFRTQ